MHPTKRPLAPLYGYLLSPGASNMTFARLGSGMMRWLVAIVLVVALTPVAFAADAWSPDDAAHLFRRAGFGGTPQQGAALHGQPGGEARRLHDRAEPAVPEERAGELQAADRGDHS